MAKVASAIPATPAVRPKATAAQILGAFASTFKPRNLTDEERKEEESRRLAIEERRARASKDNSRKFGFVGLEGLKHLPERLAD